tara:strand:+ start:181 stop:423 length:243 start_codon:yes stop_codon:yes gene_type:complete
MALVGAVLPAKPVFAVVSVIINALIELLKYAVLVLSEFGGAVFIIEPSGNIKPLPGLAIFRFALLTKILSEFPVILITMI